MFDEYFEGEYYTNKFLIKGTKEDIEEIKNNKEYDVEVLSETEDVFVTIEVSKDTYVEDIIKNHPDVMMVGFVEDWSVYDVYVAFSDFGSDTIDACERVGYFDRDHDYNWHDSCDITAEHVSVEMSYNGEKETQTYNFPFAEEWNVE